MKRKESRVNVRRVLILHDYAGARGGAELLSCDLKQMLRRKGVQVRALSSSADQYTEEHAPDAIFQGFTGPCRALPEVANYSAWRAVRRELTAFKPDLVHITMFLTQASPVILSLFRHVPVVYSV